MRIVVGVDAEGAYEGALAWVQSLQFAQPEVILASVVEPPRPPVLGVIAPFSEEAYLQAVQAQTASPADAHLTTAQQQLQAHGIAAETALLHGQASAKLLELADAAGRRPDCAGRDAQRRAASALGR
jgi:nucleotide-binding universal stress UspA family protein